MRDRELMRRVTDYASAEMKAVPGISEDAALQILCAVSLWLGQYYDHCDQPDKYPMPTLSMSLKNAHHLL